MLNENQRERFDQPRLSQRPDHCDHSVRRNAHPQHQRCAGAFLFMGNEGDLVVDQQFALAERVLAAGLLPIVEPEVDIATPDKAGAETLLKAAILERLSTLGQSKIALKITIPTVDGFYSDLMTHPNIARVVALSGGYDASIDSIYEASITV